MSYFISKGWTISINSKSMGSIKSCSGLEMTMDTEDTTVANATDNVKTFMASWADAGEINLEALHDTDDVSQAEINSIILAGEPVPFEIENTEANVSVSGNAVVTKYKVVEFEAGTGLLRWSATLKVSGKPTITLAAT